MREQRHALAFEGTPKLRARKEPVDAEFHAPLDAGKRSATQAGSSRRLVG
ncbi:MAG TPA: hypothetical protein VN029_12530 [Sphingomonas sp.]|nr:hypothetical protein [Sphingomonas sp.]